MLFGITHHYSTFRGGPLQHSFLPGPSYIQGRVHVFYCRNTSYCLSHPFMRLIWFSRLILAQFDSGSIPSESPVLMSTSYMLPFHACVQSSSPCTSMQTLLPSLQVLLHTRMGHSWACRKWIPCEIQKIPTNQKQFSWMCFLFRIISSGFTQVDLWPCWSLLQSRTAVLVFVFFPPFKILNSILIEFISSKNTF